ncbi:MAG: peptide deformylase [Proteobacteria bacterium]|nr:peptide deformylase [Pseudomonadota bacterium]MBU1715712.1 peptide deformylase [Pseudomonadota bacterium]
MAIQPIVTFPQPVLRDKAKKVTKFDDELKNLINDMAATMYDAPGVGLAAPQIGVSLQLTVIDTSRNKEERNFLVLANPIIVKGEGEQVDEEGCLSVREYAANVKRYEKIWVEAQDINGEPLKFEAEGFFARVVQHELDHLNGTLFIDHLSSLKRTLYKKKLKKILLEDEQE